MGPQTFADTIEQDLATLEEFAQIISREVTWTEEAKWESRAHIGATRRPPAQEA